MNGVFLRDFSEVYGGSFQPNYYINERLKIIEKLKNQYKDHLFKLKHIANFLNQKSIAKNVEIYIGMANIESNTGLYLESSENKGQGECNIFNKGEVLFGKLRPYLNKVYYAEFNGGCSSEFIVLDSIDKEKISNKFLSIFLLLDCVVNQTKYLMTGNTLPRLQINDIENLLIPLPPKNTQQYLIDIIDNAYKIKKQKEQEAKELLDSIDEYLLDELGIVMPTKSNNTLGNRIFMQSFSNISDTRFDPNYHQKYYQDLEKALQKGKYSLVRLVEKVLINNILEDMAKYEVINYIDLSSIDKENGSIENIKSVNDNFPSRARQKVCKGDLLVSTLSGSMKAIAIVNDSKKNLIASTGFFVIRHTNDLLKDFLMFLLRINLFQELLKRESSGAIMASISQNEFLNLKIPLPPLTEQERIANEIRKRQERAKTLQQKAKEILESAKKQVESIILGG